MDTDRHISVIREKQRLLPLIGEKYAKLILEEVPQGDGLADEIDDLLVEIYQPCDFSGDDGQYEAHEDLTDGVWANILQALSAMVHRLNAEHARKLEVPIPLPLDPELEALIREEEEIERQRAEEVRVRNEDHRPDY